MQTDSIKKWIACESLTNNFISMKKIMHFEETYQAPEVTIIDIQSEGVLCQSGAGLGVGDWEDDGSLNF